MTRSSAPSRVVTRLARPVLRHRQDHDAATLLRLPQVRRCWPKQPLRVLVITESFLPQVNGVTNSVRRVLEHLAAEGHQAEVIAPTGPSTYAGFPVNHTRGAKLPWYPDFRIGLESRQRLRAAIERFQPDICHLASPAVLGYQAAAVAKELEIPTVAIYQTDLVGFAEQYAVPGGARAMASLTRRLHGGVDLTLAPSSASLAQLEAMGLTALAHWPRGVDTALFAPAKRNPQWREAMLGDAELLVGYVGRLAPEKELQLLRLLDATPNVRLVLVGGGPEEARLREALPRAEFAGVLHGEELAQAYASLDVFVHTGRHETFCQAAQEALASGVPVVAPRAGGPMDLVAEGLTGWFYEPGDAEGLTRAVLNLAADPMGRLRMGLAARRSVEGRSWAQVSHALVQHYRRVIADRAGVPAAVWSAQSARVRIS